jgi:hypothetical protein
MRSAWKMLAGVAQRGRAPAGHDGARDARGEALFAVRAEEGGELIGAARGEDVGGGLPAGIGRIEAHVERLVARKGEAALAGVEVKGADTEVEEDAVDRGAAVRRQHVAQGGKVGVGETQAAVSDGAGEAAAQGGEDLRIAVDAEHAPVGRRRIEERAAVAAAVDGGVDVPTSRSRRQVGQHLGQEDGGVKGVAHGVWPVRRA